MTSSKRHLPALSVVASTARLLLDIAFPPRCPSCREEVVGNGNFCAACFEQLRMISAPLCHCCGVPFVVSVEKEALCPECLVAPPAFDMARSAMVYDKISGPLISALKFHDQWAGIERHTQMLIGTGHAALAGADYLVPVPLHWRRLLKRKYNQSALLAYGIGKQVSIACAPHFLQRVLPTPPQMKLDRAERLKNVKKAFAVPESAKAALKDKIIVLIDDVITTGATANACALVLKKAGAKEVRVLTLARTVRE